MHPGGTPSCHPPPGSSSRHPAVARLGPPTYINPSVTLSCTCTYPSRHNDSLSCSGVFPSSHSISISCTGICPPSLSISLSCTCICPPSHSISPSCTCICLQSTNASMLHLSVHLMLEMLPGYPDSSSTFCHFYGRHLQLIHFFPEMQICLQEVNLANRWSIRVGVCYQPLG